MLARALLLVSIAGLPLLEDQHGRSDGLARHAEQRVLLLSAPPDRLRQMKAWELGVRPRLAQEVVILRVVDGRRIAPAERSSAIESLRQRVPADIRLLLDWDGAYWTTLGLDSKEVELNFFHAGRRLPLRVRGRYREDTAVELLKPLEGFGRP